MFANDLTVYKQIKISDTFMGSVIGQIGIVGTFIWLSFFYRSFLNILFQKTMPGSIII